MCEGLGGVLCCTQVPDLGLGGDWVEDTDLCGTLVHGKVLNRIEKWVDVNIIGGPRR